MPPSPEQANDLGLHVQNSQPELDGKMVIVTTTKYQLRSPQTPTCGITILLLLTTIYRHAFLIDLTLSEVRRSKMVWNFIPKKTCLLDDLHGLASSLLWCRYREIGVRVEYLFEFISRRITEQLVRWPELLGKWTVAFRGQIPCTLRKVNKHRYSHKLSENGRLGGSSLMQKLKLNYLVFDFRNFLSMWAVPFHFSIITSTKSK